MSPPLDLNANLIPEASCVLWRPVHRSDGRDSLCECGQTFFEHKLIMREFLPQERSTVSCKPWCHSIMKLGNEPCNCKAPIKIETKPDQHFCAKWQESSTFKGTCICGLRWYMHSFGARAGFVDQVAYDRAQAKNEVLMSNEEAIAWLKLMGRNRDERIEKIQTLLRTAKQDDMSTGDQLVLEGMLEILQEEQFEEIAQEAAKVATTSLSKRSCPMCGDEIEPDRKDMCSDCQELMVQEADEGVFTEISEVDPANGSVEVKG